MTQRAWRGFLSSDLRGRGLLFYKGRNKELLQLSDPYHPQLLPLKCPESQPTDSPVPGYGLDKDEEGWGEAAGWGY